MQPSKSSELRAIYSVVRSYIFNGTFAYAIFGIYALVVTPYIKQFVVYGEKSLFIALFGFIMLIAEFFALNFKLKMVRIRTEEKRLQYKKETGIDIIPRPGGLVIFGLFARLGLRLAAVMVCLSALGFTCNEKKMDTPALWITFMWFFIDFCGLVYTYMSSGIYREPAQNKREEMEEEKENTEWDKANLSLGDSTQFYLKEITADIILQVYSVMMFTALWTYINESGIKMLYDSFYKGATASAAAWNLFPMLILLSVVGIMPIRIAYWIEDSMMAFTRKEKLGMTVIFIFVALLTCSPALIKYWSVYFIDSPSMLNYVSSPYLNIYLILLLLLLILIVQMIVAGNPNSSRKIAVLKQGSTQ